MNTIIVWLWSDKGKPSFPRWQHSKYDARHVNAVYRMVQRHYTTPHRFVCITDNPAGIECETILLADAVAHANRSHNPGDLLRMSGIIPGTWVRLLTWAPDMHKLLGKRIISLDLDCVVVDDVAPLFDQPGDFIGWFAFGRRDNPCVYNASIWAQKLETRRDIWDTFDAETAASELLRAGYRHFHGTEQAWQSYKLGPDQKAWTWRDGVASYRYQVRKMQKCGLTPGARIVFFHGPEKPWQLRDHLPWVKEHYPATEVGL